MLTDMICLLPPSPFPRAAEEAKAKELLHMAVELLVLDHKVHDSWCLQRARYCYPEQSTAGTTQDHDVHSSHGFRTSTGSRRDLKLAGLIVHAKMEGIAGATM